MIDNQQAAQLLFNHQLATQEQILSVWQSVTDEQDVGMLLVEKGILSQQTYREMVAYLQSMAPASAANQETPPPAASPHGDLVIEHTPQPTLADIDPPELDPSIVGFTEENWTAVDEEFPEVKKSSRADHQMRKAMASQAIESQQHTDAEAAQAAQSTAGAEAVAAAEIQPLSTAAKMAAPAQAAHVEKDTTAAPKPRLTRESRPSLDGPKVAVPQAVGPQSTWDELLAFARHHEAADLHLSAGNPILLRRYGALQAATQEPMVQESLRTWVEGALNAEQLAHFEAKGDLELIYTLPHYGRYRVTMLKQRRGWDVTARVIPDRIRTMEEVGLPESCRDLTKWAQGLVLVTGPVGCGKSSTLATLVDIVNQDRHDHIITIEEPIEILYPPAHCRITQRQVGPHTLSRDAALRAALREDPDIIVISELRDLDTIRLAVSAAETGHLVFGTMNTTNAARTLYRLIDSFPPEEQGIIRNMISESLRGVISQQLLPRKDGSGVVPAFEVLLVNTAVANMIRKDEAHQLGTAMLTGKSSGMVLLDDSLRALVERGLVDPLKAMARATSPKDFEKYTGRR